MKIFSLVLVFYLFLNPGGIDFRQNFKSERVPTDTPAIIKFDEYGILNLKSEKKRLKKLVKKLQNSKNYNISYSTIYVFVYGKCQGEGEKHIEVIRDYLVNENGIDENRLNFKTQFCNPKFKVELWIVPPGAIPPTEETGELITCPVC